MLGDEDWRNLKVALEVTEEFFHFSNICEWLDILVFSDEDKNCRPQAVTSTSTNLTLVGQNKSNSLAD